MSVSRGSLERGPNEGWADLEIQTVQTRYQVADGDLPLGADIILEDAVHWEPAGGLDRGELAELVELQVWGVFAFVGPEPGAGTTPGNADHKWELSANPDAQLIDSPGETIGINGTVVNTRAEFATDTPDIFYFITPHNFQAFNDTVNGSGGGPTMHMAHQHRNFREAFGAGPILDQHDRVYEHVAIFEHEVENEDIFLYANYQMVWDVFDKE